MPELAGHELEVPFGPAAGVLNGVNEQLLIEQTRDVLNSPASIAWLGSFTCEPHHGNEPNYGVVYRNEEHTGRTLNFMGLPNIGLERALAIFPELNKQAADSNTLLVPSVSTAHGEQVEDVLPEMVERFAEAGAVLVEVNYSCPNKVDEHGAYDSLVGYDLEIMSDIEDEIFDRVGHDVYVSRKLPPYIEKNGTKNMIEDVTKLLDFSKNHKIFNLSNAKGAAPPLASIATEEVVRGGNGLPARERSVLERMGALSGPATARLGCEQLAEFRRLLPDADLLSCLGVMTGEDVYQRVYDMGAVAASGVTLFYENEKPPLNLSYGQTCLRVTEQLVEAQEKRR